MKLLSVCSIAGP